MFKAESNVIYSKELKNFDILSFLGPGWSILEEDDKIIEIEIDKIRLETTLRKSESYLDADERIERLKKKKCIRLNAKILLYFWENIEKIPDFFKDKTKGGQIKYITFDGTILKTPSGQKCALCLFWDNEWKIEYRWSSLTRGSDRIYFSKYYSIIYSN